MIDKTNMQGVMNVIRQAEMANSRAADASLGISNEQQQSRFASDLLAAIRSVNATQMRSAETKTSFEATEDVSVTDVLIDSQRASVAFRGDASGSQQGPEGLSRCYEHACLICQASTRGNRRWKQHSKNDL